MREAATLAVCFAQPASPEQLYAAMQAVQGAGYVYAHTKPSAKPTLHKVLFGMPRSCGHPRGFCLWAGADRRRGAGPRVGQPPACIRLTPPNSLKWQKPLCARANAGAAKKAFACEVLDRAKVEKLGMGAFLSVANGTDEPLRFIVLHYHGAATRQQPLVFVWARASPSTAAAFPKPGAGMDEMKFGYGRRGQRAGPV